jgi:hypothetical protein
MKKLSKINESHWSEMNRRSQGIAVRREEGIRVKTCLGTYAFLKNPNCKYDELINFLMTENYDDDQFRVNNARDLNLSPDELVNVRKWTAPYDYMIYEPGYGMDLVVSFDSFDTMTEYERLEDLDDFLEDDYISICKCIATKLKEVADSMERVKREHFIIHWDKAKFTKDYCLCLVKEEQVYDWKCENLSDEGYTYWEDFRYDMIDEFPELDTVDFVCWTYRDGCNIGIPMYPKENVINFTKYKEFAQNWFKV